MVVSRRCSAAPGQFAQRRTAASVEEELAISAGRIGLVRAGHVDIMLGLQMSRLMPMRRLGHAVLVDRALKMMRRVVVVTYIRQEQAVMERMHSRPSLAAIQMPDTGAALPP